MTERARCSLFALALALAERRIGRPASERAAPVARPSPLLSAPLLAGQSRAQLWVNLAARSLPPRSSAVGRPARRPGGQQVGQFTHNNPKPCSSHFNVVRSASSNKWPRWPTGRACVCERPASQPASDHDAGLRSRVNDLHGARPTSERAAGQLAS